MVRGWYCCCFCGGVGVFSQIGYGDIRPFLVGWFWFLVLAMGEFVATLAREDWDNQHDNWDAGALESCHTQTVTFAICVPSSQTSANAWVRRNTKVILATLWDRAWLVKVTNGLHTGWVRVAWCASALVRTLAIIFVARGIITAQTLST